MLSEDNRENHSISEGKTSFQRKEHHSRGFQTMSPCSGERSRSTGQPGGQCSPVGVCARQDLASAFSTSRGRARPPEWGGAMFLGGRVRAPEPRRASVLRRACTSDGGGGQGPSVGACARRGLGSVYVVRRTCMPDGAGDRGGGVRVPRRACTPDEAHRRL